MNSRNVTYVGTAGIKDKKPYPMYVLKTINKLKGIHYNGTTDS